MASRETCPGHSVPVVRLALEKDRCIRRGKTPERITSSKDVVEMVSKHYGCKPQEFMLVLHLNSAKELLGIHEVAMGAIAEAQVDPKVLFAGAVASGASAIILIHNHPSGDATPSAGDVSLTTRVRQGSELLAIQLLDHVVIARGGGYTSMVEKFGRVP